MRCLHTFSSCGCVTSLGRSFRLSTDLVYLPLPYHVLSLMVSVSSGLNLLTMLATFLLLYLKLHI